MYYRIGNCDNLKIVGKVPQTRIKETPTTKKPYNYFGLRNDRILESEPYFELELQPAAKITNYLSEFLGFPGWIIDKKLLNILKKFSLPMYNYYPISVFKQKEEMEYYYFHFVITNNWEFINTEKSYGELIKFEGGNIKVEDKVAPNNIEEMIATGNQYKFPYNIRMGKLYLKQDFSNYDLYFFNYFGIDTVISERLKCKIEEENITGIKMTPWDRIIIEN